MSDSEQQVPVQDPPQAEEEPREETGPQEDVNETGDNSPTTGAPDAAGSEEELSDVDEEQFQEEPLDDEVYQLSSHRKKNEGPKRVKERRRPAKKQTEDDAPGDVPQSATTSPAKRRRKSPTSAKPKADEDEEEIDDSTRQRRELESRIDAVLKPSTTKRKKVSGDDLEQMQDDAIAALRDKMRMVAVEDAECIKEGKPALNKIRMLPEVTTILRKESLADSILDGNLLESARMWLEPLPDASLPSFEIQREIFSALETLPIKTIHLRESGLGRVVLFYQKSKRPHPYIKRTADRLIGDWTRPIMGRSDNYRDKMVRTATFNPQELATAASTSSQSRKPEVLTPYEESARRRNRAALPTARGVTYDVAPMNTVANSIAQAGKHAAGGGDSQLKRMKTKLQNSSKTQRSRKSQVSVEGRGLN